MVPEIFAVPRGSVGNDGDTQQAGAGAGQLSAYTPRADTADGNTRTGPSDVVGP